MLNYGRFVKKPVPAPLSGLDPTIARMQSIALELEEIKHVLNKLESRDTNAADIAALDAIEKRLDALEIELFYDSLN